jgi:crossover junction endodeoxyribonuclease RuvC
MSSSGKLLRTEKENVSGYVIGLDASITSFGVYCLPYKCGGEHYGFALGSDPKLGSDTYRTQWLYEEIITTLGNLPRPIVSVCIEDYGPINARSGKITARAEMIGLLKWHFIRELKVPIIAVPPTSLKKFATGKANAKKDEIMGWAAHEGFIASCSDEADAYFCAKLARMLLDGQKVNVNYSRENLR